MWVRPWRQPKVFISHTIGGFPYKHSHGFLPFKRLNGVLLMTRAAAQTLSPQNLMGRLASNNKDLETFRIWRCLHSTHLFFCGVATHEVLCRIPFSVKYFDRHINSVPLSLLTFCTFWLNCRWTMRQNFGKTVFTSVFSRSRCIQTAREISSTMVRKYTSLHEEGSR